MNLRAQLTSAWLGLVGLNIAFAALLLMRMLPPFDPAWSAAQTAWYYRHYQTEIIAGSMMLQLTSVLFMPFFGALCMQIERMERPSRQWTYSFMMTAAMGITTFLLSEILFTVAAYRPERPDAIIQAISDFGFVLFVGPALPGTGMMVICGAAVLADRNPEPIFPRWVGFANIWLGILAMPGLLIGLFTKGPFAWDGALAWWVAAIAFGLWINLMFWAIRRAILREMAA